MRTITIILNLIAVIIDHVILYFAGTGVLGVDCVVHALHPEHITDTIIEAFN